MNIARGEHTNRRRLDRLRGTETSFPPQVLQVPLTNLNCQWCICAPVWNPATLYTLDRWKPLYRFHIHSISGKQPFRNINILFNGSIKKLKRNAMSCCTIPAGCKSPSVRCGVCWCCFMVFTLMFVACHAWAGLLHSPGSLSGARYRWFIPPNLSCTRAGGRLPSTQHEWGAISMHDHINNHLCSLSAPHISGTAASCSAITWTRAAGWRPDIQKESCLFPRGCVKGTPTGRRHCRRPD